MIIANFLNKFSNEKGINNIILRLCEAAFKIAEGINDNDYVINKTVKNMGYIIVGEKIFPDHFNYSQTNLKNVEALSSGADYIITTEKDWVKIESFSIFKPIIVIEINVK